MSKKVVIIGSGFGGLAAAKELADTEFEVTLVDRNNHHLFQPLLYQVATAALSPADIAVPIRSVFRSNRNVYVFLRDAVSVDTQSNKVVLSDGELDFDFLIIATGTRHSYFGNNEWEKFAPGLKTLDDALEIREKIISSLEKAELISDKEKQKEYLTFVIVGGGPTGVELAGAIAEIAKKTIIKDYRNFLPSDTKVILIEAAGRILNSYSEDLSESAKSDLENLGVKVMLNEQVTLIDESGVKIGNQFIKTKNVIWAAGNEASELLRSLNTKLDKAGRVIVNKDLSVGENENIFVIGDAACFLNNDGKSLPGIAPVAIQQGRHAAQIIKNSHTSNTRKEFIYRDKGSMATIGKAKAVAEISKIKLKGLIAWLAWSLVHVVFLIGYRNRFRVMIEWIWHYITNSHGTRLIVNKRN
jgi:NADH dehydrogenase